jgi:hypothetical protein
VRFRSRTPAAVSSAPANSCRRGASLKRRLTNLAACSSLLNEYAGKAHEHDDATDGRLPLREQHDAEDEDGKHGESGRGPRERGDESPPGQHRHLRAKKPVGHVAQGVDFKLDATLPSVSEAYSARSE